MGQLNQTHKDLPFIISFDSTKPDTEARKVIRSHVMKGKNKGKKYEKKVLDQPSSKGDQKSLVKVAQTSISTDCITRCASIPTRVGTDIILGFEPADTVEMSLLLPVFKCEYYQHPSEHSRRMNKSITTPCSPYSLSFKASEIKAN